MRKFENVDILKSLNAVMHTKTKYYKSDFKYDVETFKKAAESQKPEDKNYIWLSRESGTHCLRERDVFFKNSSQNNTLCFFAEQSRENILAYAVEVSGMEQGKLKGNIYELNYSEYYHHVKDSALPIENTKLIYEYGEKIQKPGLFVQPVDSHLGNLISYEEQPKDTTALSDLLRNEKNIRENFKTGNIKEHIEKLSGKEKKPSIIEGLKASKKTQNIKKEKIPQKKQDISL